MSDIEVGLDAPDCTLMDQHLSTDDRCRWKQRTVAVYDSTVFTTRLRQCHAGNNYNDSGNIFLTIIRIMTVIIHNKTSTVTAESDDVPELKAM